MNGKYFEQLFFDKTDSEIHEIIYSGLYTDQGFIAAALEEQRYRKAIKSLNSFAGFLDAEIMKLLKREDIFPSDVNRKIREEAVRRKLVAPRLYAEDLHKQSTRKEEPKKDTPINYRSLNYNEIKDVPNKGLARIDEYKYTPPPAFVAPVDQSGKANPYSNPDKNYEPEKRTPTRYRNNYWLIKVGKYILILAAAALLFLIIDILRPDLKTNLLKPSDSTLLKKIENPIEKFGNKLGLNNGKLSQAEAEKLLKDKYQFDIMAFLIYDGSANKENTKVKYDRLQNEGLINYSNCGAGGNSGYCATLTDKGKLYAVSEVYKDELDNNNYINVRSTILEVGDIKSIKEATEFEGYEVAFTIKVVATPFGAIWSDFSAGTLNKTEMFEKHGDAWRIRTM